MTKETQAITSGALYLNQNRKVAVLDYNKKYIKNIFELINSDELRSVVSQFLASRKQVDSNTTFEKAGTETYLKTLKSIVLDEEGAFATFNRQEILASIEDLYSCYR